MIIIVCLDDRNGMMFNRRRQSMDRMVRRRIFKLAKDSRLWMNRYSYGQFEEEERPLVTVDEAFLEKAGKGEYCFVEDEDLTGHKAGIERIILYKWNRSYPADVHFKQELLTGFRKREEIVEFKGSSHDRISEEVYEI